MNQNFMKEKPILPLVISMSLPMVISMAINSLYNIVDSYFVAKISEDAMTAISLVYPLQNLMTAIAVGFGIAMNARIAFCLGAKDQEKADEAAVTGMFLSVIHGVILMVACMAGMPHFLRLYTKDEAIIEMGLIYQPSIRVLGHHHAWNLAGEDLPVGRQNEGFHAQYDVRLYLQHRTRSADDLRHRTISEDGDGGSRLRNRNRTDDHITCLCAILHLPSVAAFLQA